MLVNTESGGTFTFEEFADDLNAAGFVEPEQIVRGEGPNGDDVGRGGAKGVNRPRTGPGEALERETEICGNYIRVRIPLTPTLSRRERGPKAAIRKSPFTA